MNKKRIIELDILRGIALLGILIVNIFVFNAPYIHCFDHYGAFKGFQGMLFDMNISMFADKCMPIYAFLFGYGAYLIQKKFDHYGDFLNFFSRRLMVLLGIGIIHVVFFWFGDILVSYALLGFVLLFLAQFNNRILLSIAILLILFVPTYYIGIKHWDFTTYRPDKLIPYDDFMRINQSKNYIDILKLRLTEYYYFRYEQLLYYYPKALAMFIIGFVAARTNTIEFIKRNTTKAFILLFCCALVPAVWYNIKDIVHPYAVKYVLTDTIAIYIHFSAPLFQAMAYIIAILLLSQSKTVLKFLKLFSYSGRMSLTNYLLQTIVCVFIFYGFGLGYYGSLKPSTLVLLALLIYTFQSLFSYKWLQTHKMGPLERMWRYLTQKITWASK